MNITERNPRNLPVTERNRKRNFVTERNPGVGQVTERNSSTERFELPAGTILLEKYVVKKRLPVTSGEANIYVCEFEGIEYIAKIYKREDAVKPEILQKLKNLDSPYIAKIYDTGEYENFSVTILPYYKLGSLQGKKFSLSDLKKIIIPCVNEALKTLHSAGIIHKDLKPANIMQLSNNRGVALIDFGISSVMDEGISVLYTNSGFTPGYSAPETAAPKFMYLEESDYYSFGITIYELFCSHLPYENLDQVDIDRLLELDNLPFPENMPEELRNLITGLTYADLKNRNDLENPNRRWTYEEVKNWLAGKDQPLPGVYENFSYKFGEKNYSDIKKLIPALAENCAEGKKHFQRKLLSNFFSRYDTELANKIIDAEEEIQRGKNVDEVFFALIYKLLPTLQEFYWKDKKYSSLADFGWDILNKLRHADMSEKNLWDEIFANKLISKYLTSHKQAREIISAVQSLENTNEDRKNDLQKYYLMAYILTGKRELQIDDKNFSSPEELAEHMNFLLNNSESNFENFCDKLMDDNNKLNVEFESWLIALGKRNELENWKQNLKAS